MHLYHLEVDPWRPRHVIYTDRNSLKTSDGTNARLIAGSTTQHGYAEGIGGTARFNDVGGFVQKNANQIIVSDYSNFCMRKIYRLKGGATRTLSGQCGTRGYMDGKPGLFTNPWAVVKDKLNQNQLLVTDRRSSAVRTVNADTGQLGTFVKSRKLYKLEYLTQDSAGNLYVTAFQDIYRISYQESNVSLLSGSLAESGFRDGTLRQSLFEGPTDLRFIGNGSLLVSDVSNGRIRHLDLLSDRVTTLDMCQGCLKSPQSLLFTTDSLYVSNYNKIFRFQCERYQFIHCQLENTLTFPKFGYVPGFGGSMFISDYVSGAGVSGLR